MALLTGGCNRGEYLLRNRGPQRVQNHPRCDHVPTTFGNLAKAISRKDTGLCVYGISMWPVAFRDAPPVDSSYDLGDLAGSFSSSFPSFFVTDQTARPGR